MSFLKFFILFTFVITSFDLRAENTQNCGSDVNDQFEPKNGMPAGPFKNKCLSSNQRRNFYLLSPYQGLAHGYADAITNEKDPIIANISHNDRFVMAQIPMRSIKRIIFQMERFAPEWIAAHTQLRFDFDTFIELRDQKNPKVVLGTTKSLVFTVEAVPMVEGPGYDLVKGTKGYFALSYRITSLEQKYQDVVIKEKNTVNQFLLNFSKIETQQIFRQILHKYFHPTFKSNYYEMYHTLNRNCTNVLFELFDQYLMKKRGIFHKSTTAIPVISKSTLALRNLLDTKSGTYQIVDLNNEY